MYRESSEHVFNFEKLLSESKKFKFTEKGAIPLFNPLLKNDDKIINVKYFCNEELTKLIMFLTMH